MDGEKGTHARSLFNLTPSRHTQTTHDGRIYTLDIYCDKDYPEQVRD